MSIHSFSLKPNGNGKEVLPTGGMSAESVNFWVFNFPGQRKYFDQGRFFSDYARLSE